MPDDEIIRDKRWKRIFWKVIIIPHKIVMVSLIALMLIVFFFVFTLLMYKFENPASGNFAEYILSLYSKIKIPVSMKEERSDRFEVRFARLSFVSGQVSLRKGGRLRWDTAAKEAALSTGDILRTHSNSYAEVSFDDGNILQIKPDSLVIISNMTEDAWTREKLSSVKLMESDIEADIKKPEIIGSKFKIETPNAVASIREEAKVAIKVTKEQNSQIKVFAGNVDVQTSEENIKVKPAEGIEIASNKEIITIKDLPEGPVPSSPENQREFFYRDISDAEIILRWKGDNKSKLFHLEVAKDIHFIDLLISKEDISETSVSLQEMPQGSYYWRVRGINKEGHKGASSDLRMFKITLDNIPPRVLINDVLFLKERGVIILYLSGETEPNAELLINEKRLKVDSSGRFHGFFSYKGNILKIEASDIVGNKSYLEKSIADK